VKVLAPTFFCAPCKEGRLYKRPPVKVYSQYAASLNQFRQAITITSQHFKTFFLLQSSPLFPVSELIRVPRQLVPRPLRIARPGTRQTRHKRPKSLPKPPGPPPSKPNPSSVRTAPPNSKQVINDGRGKLVRGNTHPVAVESQPTSSVALPSFTLTSETHNEKHSANPQFSNTEELFQPFHKNWRHKVNLDYQNEILHSGGSTTHGRIMYKSYISHSSLLFYFFITLETDSSSSLSTLSLSLPPSLSFFLSSVMSIYSFPVFLYFLLYYIHTVHKYNFTLSPRLWPIKECCRGENSWWTGCWSWTVSLDSSHTD
jgi:hypothetical protein